MTLKEFNDKAGKILGLKEGEVIVATFVHLQDTGNMDIHMRVKKDSAKVKKLKALLKDSLNNNST